MEDEIEALHRRIAELEKQRNVDENVGYHCNVCGKAVEGDELCAAHPNAQINAVKPSKRPNGDPTVALVKQREGERPSAE